MIRRHFLAGVVGIKAMCAAAALAVGVGQTEAATYDVIFTITEAQHDYLDFDNNQAVTRTYLSEWWGMAVNAPLRGVLEMGADGIFPLLTVSGLTLFRTPDAGQAGSSETSWTEGTGAWYNTLTWTGSQGTWYRTEDQRPDYYNISADIRLAPVPLPVSAALLPMGIGALAFLRKRRRLVS